MSLRVAVVTSGFPRLSETFALNELLALRRRGMLAGVFATKPGDWSQAHPAAHALRADVRVLPAGGVEVQAGALVAHLAGVRIDGVHGYFAHQPAAVAAAAAETLGVPYGFSAHALDVRKVPTPELAERGRRAGGVVTCNAETAEALVAAGVAADLVPHGVDTRLFSPRPRSPGEPRRVLAVGRLVAKKGFDVLIRAVARLGAGVELRVVGSGPLEDPLRAEAARAGAPVTFAGPRTHAGLAAEYRRADVVAVPSVVDAGGDRDGLPNVVLEALACGRPVVASDVAALPSAVLHGRTGLLVPPGDAGALAASLRLLLEDADLRAGLGAAGRRLVLERYDLARCSAVLCRRLEAVYGRERVDA